jgi:hypothetical protein
MFSFLPFDYVSFSDPDGNGLVFMLWCKKIESPASARRRRIRRSAGCRAAWHGCGDGRAVEHIMRAPETAETIAPDADLVDPYTSAYAKFRSLYPALRAFS